MDIMRIIATALALLVTSVQSQDDDQASVLCGNTWDTVGKAAMDVDYVTKFSVIRSMAAYFCTRDPVMFQVWRPLGGLTFELVWEYPLQPPVLVPGVKKVDLHPDFHFPVEQIFRVGFAPMSNKSLPMGKNFFPQNQGSVIVSAENAYPTTFIRGQVYRFIELVFPYKFSGALCNDTADNCELPDISTPSRPLLNETTDPALPNFNGSVTTTIDPTDPFNIPGPQGPIGLPGITGNIGPDGVQGPKGPGGDTGDRGPQGKAGPQGPVGRKGLTAASIQGETCSECTGFKNPNLILGMLIWALLLSFLIVMMLVLATQRPKIAS